MTKHSISFLFLALSLVPAACSDDGDPSGEGGTDSSDETGGSGGTTDSDPTGSTTATSGPGTGSTTTAPETDTAATGSTTDDTGTGTSGDTETGTDTDTDTEGEPVDANYVFVTSTVQAPGGLGGLSGADALCQARADAAGLDGTYVAWLSTSTVHAKDRLLGARGWMRTDGKVVADDLADLTSRLRWYPIALDENGDTPMEVRVATGTNDNGLRRTDEMCTDWTSTAGNVRFGHRTSTADTWTSTGTTTCDTPLPIYCLGTDKNVAVTPEIHTGRIAFLSPPTFTPTAGIGAADALCTSEATKYSLPGTYKAWLALTSLTAASRFDTGPSTEGWVRTDGLIVFETAADMTMSNSLAPIAAYGDGSVDTNRPAARTGASTPTTTPLTTHNCNNWTSDQGNAWWGSTGVIGGGTFGQANNSSGGACNTDGRVYCLQE